MDGGSIENIPEKIFQLCKGTISAALAMPSEGKLLLFSNNGSLLLEGLRVHSILHLSAILLSLGCEIEQVHTAARVVDISVSESIHVEDDKIRSQDLIPTFKNFTNEEQCCCIHSIN